MTNTDTNTAENICDRHAGVISRVVNRYTSNDPAVSREDFWQAACVAILNGNAENVAKRSGFAESTIVGGLARHGCSALVARKNYRDRAQMAEMPTDSETGESFANTAPDTADTADTAERHDVCDAVRLALDGLPARERTAVTMRYGIGGEPHDLRTIGAALGVSLERARQIIARGSERLAIAPALAALVV